MSFETGVGAIVEFGAIVELTGSLGVGAIVLFIIGGTVSFVIGGAVSFIVGAMGSFIVGAIVSFTIGGMVSFIVGAIVLLAPIVGDKVSLATIMVGEMVVMLLGADVGGK